MSYVPVTMWRVVCDRCGVSPQDDGDYWAWIDKDSAWCEADDAGWLDVDDKQYCDDCQVWDDELDERVPRKDPVTP